MSQLPRPPQLTACPVCQEPLEPGDNFCGGCGADLAAAPPVPGSPPDDWLVAPPDGRPAARS
ncbi:zinc-ribbon domain-containing protein, partial [Streptomyces sp. ISL-11]|uniref:zinc-ribbon domain-containing protein n=1 Tax=Streptomyces sp. ISL-11 TaxID=2819174 RepID=UPI001BEA27F5